MNETAPHVTVATLVARDGHWLFVEEEVAGERVLNQPAGHWEAGESLVQAAVRETREETAWTVVPESLVGIYTYHPPDLPYAFLRFAFRARAITHHPEEPLDEGIACARWLTPEACAERMAIHRSPMVQQCLDDALAGRSLPLEWLQRLPA